MKKHKIYWPRDLLLLITQLTYIPLPKRWGSSLDRLPQAMPYLPVVGLISGLSIYGLMKLLAVAPYGVGAAVLVGVELLLGGAFLLRGLIRVADGSSLLSEEEFMDMPLSAEQGKTAEDQPARRFKMGQAGLVWGLIRCLALFFVYYMLLRDPGLGQVAVIVSAISCRWITVWMIWYFPARPPARFRRKMGRREFIIASCIALPGILIFSRIPLFAALLTALSGVYLFGYIRARAYGTLEEDCYAAAGCFAELLFLATWIILANLL